MHTCLHTCMHTLKGVAASTPVRALCFAFAVHCSYFATEMLHARYCAPSHGFFYAFFTSGSSTCRLLRRFSDMSSDALPTLLATAAYSLGAARGLSTGKGA